MENINKRRVAHFVEKVRTELWVIRGRKIAVWGLAFKANTDDVRFAPAIELLRALVHDGAEVRAYDPHAIEKAKAVFLDADYCASPYEAARDAEAILIVTEWEEFRQIDWQRLRAVVYRPLIFDARNTLDATELTRHGFHYISIGRPPVMSESIGSEEPTPASAPVEQERLPESL